MNAGARRLDGFTEKMIGCAYRVADVPESGFLEKVYENALAVELRKSGLAIDQRKRIGILSDGRVVGDYVLDILGCGFVGRRSRSRRVESRKGTRRYAKDALPLLPASYPARGFPLMNSGRSRFRIERITNHFRHRRSSAVSMLSCCIY